MPDKVPADRSATEGTDPHAKLAGLHTSPGWGEAGAALSRARPGSPRVSRPGGAAELTGCGSAAPRTLRRGRPAPRRASLQFASCPDALKRKRLASSSQPRARLCQAMACPTRGRRRGASCPQGRPESPSSSSSPTLGFFPPAPALNSGMGRPCQARAVTVVRLGTLGTPRVEGPQQAEAWQHR